ncbi:ser arg-related nuclear matrix [Pyrenophora seminiperda CCB06]|uniref:Ser arg-related nuclear matrix n=1 Tax=Pyrenophora seminiperda CCB06 TaxID=1302712 RepID=A0A3M7LZ32_9PLEO|nr:ser arg-related nuclear matrix [Pyrenophora seminiperda CCB06]
MTLRMPLVRPPLPPRPSSASANQQSTEVPTLKACPRPSFVEGHNDWLQVVSPKTIPNFDICPDCYNTSFRNTRYGSLMRVGPAKPAGLPCACDFSMAWIRLAYLWLYQQNQADLSLLGAVAGIQPDKDGICPNLNLQDAQVKQGGKPSVTRTWYCVRDPQTGAPVEELTACSHCVSHVSTIFPCLSNIFVPVENGQKLLATCDLMSLGDAQQRGLEYLDQIAKTADSTVKTKTRDLGSLVEYIRKWGPVSVCRKGKGVWNERQYSLPSTVPEFTACEECYQKHIFPLYSQSPRPAILSHIQAEGPKEGGFLCDLFSPRLQGYFNDAVRTNDLGTFRQKLMARNEKMREVDMQLVRMMQECKQLKMQGNAHMSQMRISQMQAVSASTRMLATGWYGPPIDWTMTNAQMAKANEKNMEAAIIEDKMTALKNEWAQFWM